MSTCNADRGVGAYEREPSRIKPGVAKLTLLDPSNVRPLFASMSVFLPSRAEPCQPPDERPPQQHIDAQHCMLENSAKHVPRKSAQAPHEICRGSAPFSERFCRPCTSRIAAKSVQCVSTSL